MWETLRAAGRLPLPPRFAEALDSRVQTAFDRSDWHRHCLGCVTVLHPLEVNQVYRVAKGLGQGLDLAADPIALLHALGSERRVAAVASHEVDERAYRLAIRLRLVQAQAAMPAVAPLGVDRLIGRDGVQPGAELSTLFEHLAFCVDLQEGGLENILCQRRVAQEPPQIVI